MKVITACIAGKRHRAAGRPGQDAVAVSAADGVAAVAVADGCSEGARSELGAGAGARFVVAAARKRIAAGVALAELPAAVLADLVEELRRLARAWAVDAADAIEVVEQHLLFTVQAAVVVGHACVVFGVGDGVVVVDGEVRVIDQGEAPDYPAYALFPAMAAPRLVVHHAGAFESIVVATDGAKELPDVAGFARDERFLKNPGLAQKALFAWSGAHDDCTLAIVRRTP